MAGGFLVPEEIKQLMWLNDQGDDPMIGMQLIVRYAASRGLK